MWIFSVKDIVIEDGSVGESYKSRMIDKNFHQVKEMDYERALSFAVSLKTNRLRISSVPCDHH